MEKVDIAEKYGIDVTARYVVSVDYENNAEEWWDCGGRRLWRWFSVSNFWKDEKTASGKRVVEFLALAEEIPGWNTGPDCAKFPVCVTEVD